VALRALKRITTSASYSAFVLGNHDYHGKTPSTVQRFIERAGFDDITNRQTVLSVNGARLRFIGVDDAYFGAPYSPHSLPHDGFNVVLTHNLDALRRNFPANVELVLSGHTHWGELNTDWLQRLKVFDGIWWMNKWGYCDNVNGHTQAWDRLTERTLSYVHPGLARHYVPLSFAHMPGFSLHTVKTSRPTPTCK